MFCAFRVHEENKPKYYSDTNFINCSNNLLLPYNSEPKIPEFLNDKYSYFHKENWQTLLS